MTLYKREEEKKKVNSTETIIFQGAHILIIITYLFIYFFKVPLNRSMAANGMTALYYPSGIAATSLLPKITGGGVVVAGGLHPDIATQYFRVGHMNISATNLDNGHLDKTIKVIIASLNECGYSQ